MQKPSYQNPPSFFYIQDQNFSQTKFWNSFCPINFQKDYIQAEWSCNEIWSGNMTPILLHLGEETLYCSSNGQMLGMIPLTFTTFATAFYDGQLIIRLVKNQEKIDFKISNIDQVKKLLASKYYNVEKLIGKGSFAHVYLTTKNSTGGQYAVKVFSKFELGKQIKGRLALMNEIAIMRKLNQENLLHIYEVYETANSIYLVMGLVEGGELLQRFNSKVYDGVTLQKLMYNFLLALNYLNSKKCMHRDIKPQNILLRSQDSDVDIVIADFGLAMFSDEKPLFKRCGTPGFIAPEIFQYQKGKIFYNEKCDIFSAGVILYMLVARRLPFEEDNFDSIVEKNEECNIDFDVQEIIQSPKSLQELMKKMLELNPTKRFSAQECLLHLYFSEVFVTQPELETGGKFSFIKAFISISKKCYNQNQIDSFELVTREQQWDGNINTIGSFSNTSKNSSQNRSDNSSPRFSQFSQIQQKQPAVVKKRIEDSLRKVALKNAWQQNLHTKDDEDIIDEQVTGLEDKLSKLNKQSPKGGFKKSNSWNI